MILLIINGLAIYLDIDSEAEEARARLAVTETKLDASEAYCRDVEGKLAFLVKKSEHTLGEQRLKVGYS